MTYVLPEDGAFTNKETLARFTRAVLNETKHLLRGSTDADVTFVPHDPLAQDNAAANSDEVGIAWTLGHIIAHTTASSEESAALAAEIARGVSFHGRSRYEIPWQTVTTVRQLYSRLDESRRMRLASLGMWPDHPDLTIKSALWDGAPGENAIQRYLAGLRHEAGHLEQIRDVVAQARTYRRRQSWWWRLFHPRSRRAGAGLPTAASDAASDAAPQTVGAPEVSPAQAPSDEGNSPTVAATGSGQVERSAVKPPSSTGGD